MQPTLPPPPDEQPENIVLTIGDIGVTQSWVVTPNGSAPLAGSTWIAQDQSRTERKIPTWAIVLAIIFALLCLVGLFFLLVKETTVSGHFEVTVRSGSLMHMTQIPVVHENQVHQLRALVAQAQSMAAVAAPR
jgi:hypothetical protein